MKILRTIFLASIAIVFASQSMTAQFMPVVYDNTYGKSYGFTDACADFQNGDIVTVGTDEGYVILSWVDRVGETRFSKRFGSGDLASVNRVIALGEDKVLLVGSRAVSDKDKNRKAGRALVINVKGVVERTISVGDGGTELTNGQIMSNGNIVLSGHTRNAAGGKSGFISKVSADNKEIYTYVPAVGGTCDWFNIMGSRTEFINVGFSAVDGKGSTVIRLDAKGKPFFITTLSDPTFRIENMTSDVNGEIYLVGQGASVGGVAVKIRTEGDIVFERQIVPATAQTRLNNLIVYPTGELMVGGSDSSDAYFALLRSDGTQLTSYRERGHLSGMMNNTANGDCYVSVYNPSLKQGRMVKFSSQGHRLFEKMTSADYTSLLINVNGDVLMASPQSGRLSMLSNFGELLFDRFVVENTPQQFSHAILPSTGEAFFVSGGNRIAKLAHGLYISDITVSKPINGQSTAVFTVTLSGYSFNREGSPVPVTVGYSTSPITAAVGVNYESVSGTLSFVPSADGGDRYLNKAIVEVPIMANDLLEGNRTFALNLAGADNSYLIKPSSVATIKDQPAIVRMINTTPGTEGENDVVFELGLFKTNGTKLTNATRSEVVVEGLYGNGTADKLDFDMARTPRFIIPAGKHSGSFNVLTLEDMRYESVKTVVLSLNNISAMSDTDVSFGSNILLCTGQIYDQPAYVTIESLGDHTKLNNVISGLYKVTIVRAKDDVPLVNCSGADVVVTPQVNDEGTAKQGTDFVFSNAHDLRIWGDDKSSAVNLNGMVLYSPDRGVKSVSVSLKDVKGGPDAGKLQVHPTKNSARFRIVNE